MGQTIISAGLVIIVTIAVINANRLVVNAEISKLEGLARMEAADIAMSIITEARMKKFDELEVTSYYQATTEFTGQNSLGRDSYEWAGNPDYSPFNSASSFDDFDDYNGYTRYVTTTHIQGYLVRCKVFYSTPEQPDVDVSTRSYFKTLQVVVSHSTYLPGGMTISMTKSY